MLHCHPYSIYAAIYEGRLSAVKLRGNVRIKADELERLLAARERLERKLSVTEVSRILACSPSTVLRAIRARKMKAERIGNRYCIAPQDLENYVLSLPKA